MYFKTLKVFIFLIDCRIRHVGERLRFVEKRGQHNDEERGRRGSWWSHLLGIRVWAQLWQK